MVTPPPRDDVPLSLMIDFDGTLVEPNVAIVLVEQFCPDGARVANEVDLLLHSGKMTLREAWEREAALMRADQIPEMIDYVVRHIPLREGAHELLGLLARHRVPTQIVSGGLDFYIDPVLKREGIDLPVRSDTSTTAPDGHLRVLHPHGHATCRLCGICKAQVVRGSGGNGTRVAFVGDGSTDQYAAEVADIVFARRRLLDLCRKRGIPAYPFEAFPPVTERLRGWLEEGEPLPPPRPLGLADSACPISRDLSGADT
ncbi:MAG TPA: HAD-IB family phosphatase [Thermoplasmata archaeon]|nr:HAD-IB family phosphatase [Thermoplasmata archaeon]